jgi:ABC-type bacteriocin/lantibiotic exporter with double-glycine peptidase domain
LKYQLTDFSCGPAALVNAFRCFGKRVSERKIYKSSRTDKSGTGDVGIENAISDFGFFSFRIETEQFHDGWDLLIENLHRGFPVIVCVSNHQHWVTVVGCVGERLIVVDPTGTKQNLKENGVHIFTKNHFRKKWLGPKTKFLGIVVADKLP